MKKKVLISAISILIFAVGFTTSWLVFGQKNNQSDKASGEVARNTQSSSDNKTAQDKSEKLEDSSNSVASSVKLKNELIESPEGLVITHPDQLAFLNISDNLKSYIAQNVKYSDPNSRECGVAFHVRVVYGDYMIGGVGGHSQNPSLQCAGGAIIIAGLKDGKVEHLGGGHVAPSCAEKTAWNLPAEFAKHIECQ